MYVSIYKLGLRALHIRRTAVQMNLVEIITKHMDYWTTILAVATRFKRRNSYEKP